MKKTWITADWHLGETRMEIMGRPFKTPEEHISHMIREHNKLVSPDDVKFCPKSYNFNTNSLF